MYNRIRSEFHLSILNNLIYFLIFAWFLLDILNPYIINKGNWFWWYTIRPTYKKGF